MVDWGFFYCRIDKKQSFDDKVKAVNELLAADKKQ